MTKQTFIKGAMILLAAGIVNRILGFVPRITLPRIIGAEGVGLYQLSYPFLIVMLTIITGGIPLAIAKWIAEAESTGDTRRANHIFRTAMLLTVAVAVVLTIAMLLFAPYIIRYLLPDTRVYRTFLMMTPLLLIIGVSSVYRGYFQGKQNMIPGALSQTLETIIRIIASLVFAYMLLPYGLEWAAAGAMLGVVAGELGGLAVLLWNFRRRKEDRKSRKTVADRDEPGTAENMGKGTNSVKKGAVGSEPVLKRLLGLSLPVTGSKLVGSLSYLLESIFTAKSLAAAGIVTGIATAQYGALQGMIIPLLLLPTALTYSLAVSLVPSLSEAAARGDKALIQKRMHQSMRIALVSGAPFVVVMSLFAEPLCRIIYAHEEYAPMLQLMAPIGIFIYLQAPLQAALQALDKPGSALMNTFIGAAVKLILIVQLASKPELGIYGALIAINVNIVLVTLLHGISVLRFIGFRMKFTDFVKVGAAMVIMGAAAQWIMHRMPMTLEWIALVSACFISVILYLLLMIWMKIIDRHDIARIPWIGAWFR
ncbi:stage V sporulation protein B [Paenibacillus sp. LHD-117]|uniref:stage V sporulation protein B n=1 Tax=Paenibacillus sp. LHD-117 TaxID=3071412 RepID=UPI0027DF2743|nr:stage V sporulation protein B [Paenibacillus sp. LHD-117]MDQ6418599.1 stage V sporulation protein B [Paenibacillus sp. LHD-117]